MTFGSYPSCSPSSVAWIDEVPEHWEVRRIKTLFREIDDRNGDQNRELLSLTRRRGLIPHREATSKLASAADHTKYKVCRPGNLVMNRMQAWSGMFALPSIEGIVSPDYSVFEPIEKCDLRFYEYLFKTQEMVGQFAQHSKGIGTGFNRLYTESFGSIFAVAPPLDEQRAIARCLDYVDGQIKQYVRAKERLIELLEEQKRAVINQAVTRGMDPDVPLKPSGVEWLGDVPAHWEVRRLKFLATKFGSGVTPRGGAAVYKETGIPLLRSQNVHFDGLRLHGVARIDPKLHDELSASHVMSGDVLLNITGASIGRTCAVPEGFEDGNVNQHVCIIRPRRDVISSAFLTAFLSTSFIQRRIRNELGGASREGLTLQSIRDFEVLIPPLDEQHRITDYIRRSSESLGMCNRTLKQIELVNEYRTRLISDVVTGKLDVRDAGANLPEDDWQ